MIFPASCLVDKMELLLVILVISGSGTTLNRRSAENMARMKRTMTYGVRLLLSLVALLVDLGLLVVRGLLGVGEVLPLGSENLANLAWSMLVIVNMRRDSDVDAPNLRSGCSSLSLPRCSLAKIM